MHENRPPECTYAPNYQDREKCREPAVGELRAHSMDRASWPLCEQHIQPRMHPADLHDKLVRYASA